jgi:pimeloyl-ACP methyl ester carboxylesterase
MPGPRLLPLLALLAMPGGIHAASLPLTPCKLPGLAEEVRCGTLAVPEDRAHPQESRKIDIHVVVFPALSSPKEPDPIVYFAGGPGGDGIGEGAGLLADENGLRAHRDLLLVDVRGTGQSNALNCTSMRGAKGIQGFLSSFMPLEGVRECRKEVAAHADARFYTSAPIVDDVDDVRASLGIDKLNLMGGSYGTRASLEYVRRHPEHVRSMILDGVDPPGTQAPLTFARDAQRALDGVIARCAADAACNQAFPHFREEFEAVLSRLGAKPVKVEVKDPKSGAMVPFTLDRSGLGQTVRYMLYVPSTAAQLPLNTHLAYQGDFRGFGEIAAFFSAALTAGVADGLFLSVTCPEEVRTIRPEQIAPAIAGAFLGDFRIRQQLAACREWPAAEVPASLAEPVTSSVPTLLIDGEFDPVTPVYRAEQALRTLANGKLLVLKGGGHGNSGMKNLDCLSKVMTAFMASGSTKDLDTACVATIAPPDFVLTATEDKEVKLSSEELHAFERAYRDDKGNEIKIALVEGRLHVQFGAQDAGLTPVGAHRFKIDGLPPGFYIDFAVGADHKVILTLEQGAQGKETFSSVANP